MRIARCLWVVCLVGSACGGGNSSVQDNGVTLTPKSEAFASGTLFGIIPVVEVLVTDLDNVCGSVPAATPCALPTSGASSSAGFPIESATVLEIAGLATGQGTYQVLVPNDGGSQSSLGGVVVVFAKTVNGQDAGTDPAVSGSVTFSSLKAGSSASGSYDVVMQSGTHLSGSFSANDCPALDQLLNFSQGAQCGGSTGVATNCEESCSCNNQSISADCDQPDGGAWQCTCTSAAGQTTTCTMPSSASSANVCQPGTSCCPFSF